MSVDTRTELHNFLLSIAESLDISPTRFQEAVDRYKAVGVWLGQEDSPLSNYEPTIHPQGSFMLGTVVRPLLREDEYDIDLVCLLTIGKNNIRPQELKEIVGARLKDNEDYRRMLEPEGKRCWTLQYSDAAKFHMDILPAVPDTVLISEVKSDLTQHAIAITDSELLGKWLPSNPKGYAEWFKEQMLVSFQESKRVLALEKSLDIEQVDDFEVKTPLQRAVQILKRHRDIMFKDYPDNKPISIIITTLAALAYNNEPNLVDALLNIAREMTNYIEERKGIKWVSNPVNPKENFADKWAKNDELMRSFYQWVKKAEIDINSALNSTDLDKMTEFIKPAFGENIVNSIMASMKKKKNKPIIDIGKRLEEIDNKDDIDISRYLKPLWKVEILGSVTVDGKASKIGERTRHFKDESPLLPKEFSLSFYASTDLLPPFDVKWQVVNTGYEAEQANCLRGEFYDSDSSNKLLRLEGTKYIGRHWIECFIIKNERCVAKSGKIYVNIR